MFVQVVQGPVADAGAVKARLDRWVGEIAPSAEGWLGTTAGVTDDGTFLAVVRFDSEETARRNSERPEQDAWWRETAPLFSEEPTFSDSTEVDVETAGDPGSAGFVQVMQGRTSDPARSRELTSSDSTDWASFRPDVLGSVTAGHEGGAWTSTLYFTSEAEAREGERKEPPPEMAAVMKEMEALSIGETRFFDLRDPWLYGP